MKREVEITIIADGVDTEAAVTRTVSFGVGGVTNGMDVVELSSATGTLTTEQAALVASDHCIVKYGGNLYHKDSANTYRMIGELKTAYSVTSYKMSFTGSGYHFTADEDVRPYVEAGPSGEATETLSRIRIGYGIYAVPQGITDYEGLDNRPQIGGQTLTGNKTAEQLGLATINDITWEEN